MQFKLPELGEGVHEGELVKWAVKVGDEVKYDQPLCEIMTDKATVEIPSAFQGKVAELHSKEGDMVNVGQVMLTFEGAEKSAAATAQATAPSKTASPASAQQSLPPQVAALGIPQSASEGAPQGAQPAAQQKMAPSRPVGSAGGSGGATMSMASATAPAASHDTNPATRPLASPSTRRVARETGVDLSRIQGTGPGGRILREDLDKGNMNGGTGAIAGGPAVMRAPTSVKSYPQGGEERVALRGLRKKIAEKMRLSKDHAAHFTYVEEADATQLVQLRSQAKDIGARQGVKVTYLPFVMKAMVATLRQFPIMNASLDEEKQELVYKHYFNIGLSIQTDDGLTAPVVKNVEHKSILEIARDIQDLVERARTKKLTMHDFEGGTITLTNAGSIGGLFATPIINYPEVAILGFNKIFRKPVAAKVNGREEVVIRDWTYFSISLDHRVVDGAIGAEFMKVFIQYIENPSLLLMESI